MKNPIRRLLSANRLTFAFPLFLPLALAGYLHAADPQTGWWPPFVPDVPVPAIPPAQPAPVVGAIETLVLDTYEAAGISGFRKDWDRAIPLTAGGAMTNRTDETVNFGAGPVANWDAPNQPGALAFDAVHRSLLLRFPDAAEQIAARLAGGRTILKVELILPFLAHEVFPPASYMNPTGLSFLGQSWRNRVPRWHAVAWGLLRPWTADNNIGPTYNASIRGAAYWTGFGAREVGHDRVETVFGPTPLNVDLPQGRMDITAAVTEAAFGEDLGSRLRRLSDCGFLVRKWEAYDASFWNGGYEWGTGTGPRALLLGAPKIVVHFGPGEVNQINLPPPADIHALAQQPPSGEPTAVFPSEQEFAEWASEFGRHKPADMDNATWQRLQQLWAQDGKPHNFPETYTAYEAWIDELLSRAPRRWSGFDAAELGGLIGIRYREALPAPLVDHLRLYWWAWLMPDRETSQLVQGYVGQAAAAAYYASTRDWRGNFSVYRTYSRVQGTMNFNHWASAGTLFGGALLESPRLLVEGEAGLRDFPLKMWTWSGGTTQESIDHYYLSHSLATQLPFAAYSPTLEQRLMGEAILAKTIGELCSTFHPRLKRFTSSSGRTGLAYPLYIQDGVNSILHTVMPGGALTDLGRTTIGNGMPVIGQDFAPSLAATMALDYPWAPDWYGPMVEAKPVPYQMTAESGGRWKRSFQGQHYGVASLDVATVETVPFIIQWRNQDTVVTSSEALGMLIGRFGVNRTELLDSLWHNSSLRNPNGIVGNQGGPLASIQHRNRLFVLSSPNQGLTFDGRTRPAEITSLQTTLGLVTLHEGWSLLLDGQPVTPPFTATAGQRIVIADGVAFVGIVPLAGTNLGRDIEIEVVADGVSTQMQGGGQLAEALRINAYNYRGTALPQSEWSSEAVDEAWGGFAILAGDTTEHADAAAFDAALAAGSLNTTWDAVNRRVALSWTLDGDTLACTFAPKEANLLPVRTLNGQSLYLPPGIARECDLSAMGSTGRFQKNGFVYESDSGSMGYLLTDPVHGIAEAWRPFPEPGPLALGLPGGGMVGMFGRVGITRLTVFLNDNRVEIDGAVPAPGLATVAFVSGLPAGTEIVLNGQPALTLTGEKNGKPVTYVSLDGAPLPPKEELLNLRITATAGNWNDPATWVEGATLGVPQADDRVMINHTVTLNTTTPELAEFVNNAPLIFNGWNTRLRATEVTVNGMITHPNQTDVSGSPGVPADWTPNHRVWIVCENLTVTSDASIDVNGKGYIAGTSTSPRLGRGPGGGIESNSLSGGGGTHGGGGGLTGRGSIYGSLTVPEDPGSGGAGNNWNAGGSGGGAVRIEAVGKVTLNGTITANGNVAAHPTAGGGSGGSIFISSSMVAGGGTISANGGAISGATQGGGAGAGGRIALAYHTGAQALQNATQKPSLTIRARQGGRGFSYSDAHGEPGTIHLSDASFFPGPAVQGGILHVEGLTSLTLPSLVISGGMFGVAEGMSLTVQGDVTATGRGGLYLRNSAIAIGGDLSLSCNASDFGQTYVYAGASGSLRVDGNLTSDRVHIFYGETSPAIQSITVGGDFTLSNGAPMYVDCAATDETSPGHGARIVVGGQWRIEPGATVSLKSHSTTFSTPLFEVGSFVLDAGATINGNSLGSPGVVTPNSHGLGIGRGEGKIDAGGGGHGGAGGRNGTGFGIEYGSANAPVTPGSSGGTSAWTHAFGGSGGSCFRLVATGDVRIDGTVTMNGGDATHERAGAGSGGGIYISCRDFSGTGTIQAKGGSVTLGTRMGGGGGGGRIAVWSQSKDGWQGSLSHPGSVAGGTSGVAGGDGTLVWGVTFSVTYNANGATSGDVPTNQTLIENQSLPLASNSGNLARTGFTFAGWNTAADGSGTDYAEGVTYGTNAAITLYAKWTANTYSVNFDAQGGTVQSPASTIVTYNSTYGTLATATRTGHVFLGWWTGPGGTGIEITASSQVSNASNHTLYAKWVDLATPYTVTFDAQGGTAPSLASMSVTYNSSYGTLTTTTRIGHTFAGWWSGPGGTGTEVTTASQVSNASNHTLYAKWIANTYTVTFDAQGGTVPSLGSTSVTYNSPYETLATTTRSGYNFAGWWTGPGGTGTEITPASTVSNASNHSLYAKWEERVSITAPSALSVTSVSASQINLSWSDNSSDETGFKIERKTGSGGTWSQIATVGAGVTTFSNTGLSASTTYFYRVRSFNSLGDSDYSIEANATTQALPAAPSALSVTSVSASQINLSWSDNSSDETGFKIERKTGSGGTWSQIATVGAGGTTFSNTDLSASTTYFYRVRATNSAGDSAYSNEASATTQSGQPSTGIAWQAPTNISGDTDVVTTGELYQAWNFGTNSNATVNGVTFTGWNPTGNSSSITNGNTVLSQVDLSGNPITTGSWESFTSGTFASPFGSLSSVYRSLLFNSSHGRNLLGTAASPQNRARITFINLTVGKQYLFQVWVNDSRSGTGGSINQVFTGGATLRGSTIAGSNLPAGGTGHFATATFTANSTSQTFEWTGGGFIYITAAQLRVLTEQLPTPSAPSALSATSVSDSQINLSWTDNSDNETGFKIERKTGSGGTWSQIGTVGANVSTFSNTGLSDSTAYFYRVRATNSAGDSVYSNEASATTQSAQPSAGIAWQAPTNISGDTDVVTTGELYQAWNFGTTSNATVNGVTFTGWNPSGSSSSITNGNTVLSKVNLSGDLISTGSWQGEDFGSVSVPYANLSAGYRTILGRCSLANGLFGTAMNPQTSARITFINLTVGTEYLFQVWVNDSRAGSGGAINQIFTDGPSLRGNMNAGATPVAGGAGQFATATFTANSTSQMFEWTGAARVYITAAQLRVLPSGSEARTIRGTPIAWLAGLFGSSLDYDLLEEIDHDGDGQPTWVEYLAGTDPFDRSDAFRILETTHQPDGTTLLRWRGSVDHGVSTPFRVLASETLQPGSWILRAVAVPRDPSGITTWIDTSPLPASGRIFYRIEAPLVPE